MNFAYRRRRSESTAETITDLRVCTDCGHLIANGETPEGNPDFKLLASWDGWQLFLDCPEEGCEGFSKSPCDGCGSRLGGSRHEAGAHEIGGTRYDT